MEEVRPISQVAYHNGQIKFPTYLESLAGFIRFQAIVYKNGQLFGADGIVGKCGDLPVDSDRYWSICMNMKIR
jgi:hypothetical protein